ncbi:MAG: hypothetical protein P4L67_03610 [Candidatus Pacebacteria bacterium]|nr:hypothetical protein [Candidatus Paceibacterota bacterium]
MHQTLDDAFRKVAIKQGLLIRPSEFQFRVYRQDMNPNESTDRFLEYKDDSNLNCLDMEIPIRDLKSREFLLVNKYFVDSPSQKKRLVEHSESSPQARDRTIEAQKKQAMCTQPRLTNEDFNEDEILLNDISATTYKEYEVHKTNEHGMRQERILGLDRYNLYNEKRKNANKHINRKTDASLSCSAASESV